jgi:hypothetical protein
MLNPPNKRMLIKSLLISFHRVHLKILTNAIENNVINNQMENMNPSEKRDASGYFREVLDNLLEEIKPHDTLILEKTERRLNDKKKTDINVILDKDFKITGLSNIRVDHLKCDVDHQTLSLEVDVDLVLLKVEGAGQYQMEGKANIFPIRGYGKATFEVTELKAKGKLIAAYDDNKFTINTLQLKFDLDNVKLHLENFLDENVSEWANSLLNNIAKTLIYKTIFDNDKRKEQLKKKLKDVIEKKVNHDNELIKFFWADHTQNDH